jgi:hypothetical protein
LTHVQQLRASPAINEYNINAYPLLDGRLDGKQGQANSNASLSPFGSTIRNLYLLRQLQARFNKHLPPIARSDLTIRAVSDRLELAHKIWYTDTTFLPPSNGRSISMDDAVDGKAEKGSSGPAGAAGGAGAGGAGAGEYEKESRDSPFASGTHFGFARLSSAIKLPRDAGFAAFSKSKIRIEAVERQGNTGSGRDTDEISPFLESNLYGESYEKASFAASIGVAVHQQLLIHAIASDGDGFIPTGLDRIDNDRAKDKDKKRRHW